MPHTGHTSIEHSPAMLAIQRSVAHSFPRQDVGPRPAFCAPLDHLDLDFVAPTRTLWAHMRAEPRHAHVCHGLLRDMRFVQSQLRQRAADQPADREPAVDYFVYGSRLPGIFNLGGDLAMFATSIRRGDRVGLSTYAHACIDVVYANSIAFDLPVITVALIQGDALGGGFEWALSFDLIVAERSAKIGLPEILFNLFPGMGAYSFLSRRVGDSRAQEMIMSGRIYRAEELHAMGVIDVLAEDGEGATAASDYIAANARKHHAHRAIYRVRRRVNPVTEQELRDVVDIWVDTALGLSELDLRKMDRLAAAQDRRLQSQVPELKVAAG